MSPELTIFALVAFLIPFVTAARFGRHHHEVAHRARGDVFIYKRQSFSNTKFTFYDVGLGACGQTNVASDFIVALNIEQFGDGYPGPNCFKSITIQYNGLTAQAVIMDRCVACPSYGGLDFSRGLFDYFASESLGVIYGSWWFNDGSSSGGETTTSSTWTPPTTTSTWEQPTTTSTPAYTPPTTSSTPAYTPPSTSTTPSSISITPSTTTSIASTTSIRSTSSAFSTNYSTNSISGLAVPTGGGESPSVTNPQNLDVMNNILIKFGIFLTMAEEV